MLATAIEFEVKELPEETFAFVVRRVEQGHVGEFIQGAIQRVAAFAGPRGGPQGPPMTVAAAPEEDGSIVLEVGWPVREGTEPEPPVEVRRIPGGRAAVHLHAGSYEELPQLYARFLAAMYEAGLTPVGAPRERYLDPATPVTEIVWPVL